MAERTAEREEVAERTAVEAEAIARVDAAARSAAEDRQRAAVIAGDAAALERRAAEDGERAAELRETAAERLEKVRLSEEAAAASELRAAEHRTALAVAEVTALEAEDVARLGVRERAERKVARMILSAHTMVPPGQAPERPDKYAVSLEAIGDALGVGRTVAGERRDAAEALIVDGYRG
ncbi:hypothetical protein ACIQWR_39735 [Streptomyces sp. NPDC098789]|uniref:hypothetical protein n=1 Tax=Streptomyces sp. NPDC098789 TaxID=3366098 RepID=UPI00381D6527